MKKIEELFNEIVDLEKEIEKYTSIEHNINIESLQSLLNKKEEIDIVKKLGEFPDMLKLCAQRLEPHHLTIYLCKLSSLFHTYYNKYRIVTNDEKLTSARLLLINCTKTVLQKGLNLLGISAPKKMDKIPKGGSDGN